MQRAFRSSARLSARPSIRDSLIPGSTSSAYCVTTGPSWMRATFTPMPKWARVSRMRCPLAVRSSWAALLAGASSRSATSGSSQLAGRGLERGVDRLVLLDLGQVRRLLALELLDR